MGTGPSMFVRTNCDHCVQEGVYQVVVKRQGWEIVCSVCGRYLYDVSVPNWDERRLIAEALLADQREIQKDLAETFALFKTAVKERM